MCWRPICLKHTSTTASNPPFPPSFWIILADWCVCVCVCVCVRARAHACRSCLFSFLWFELLALVATVIVIFCLRWLNVYSFYVNFVHHVKLWFYAADLCFMNISLLLLWLLWVLCVCGKSWSWRLWERTSERQSQPMHSFVQVSCMKACMTELVHRYSIHLKL